MKFMFSESRFQQYEEERSSILRVPWHALKNASPSEGVVVPKERIDIFFYGVFYVAYEINFVRRRT